ncbi:response regulator [Phenylobacterium montanum]|uniref:Response regulator n=1 Tax=Phenylobacterium montanum TaxID=2823693 RepID=A0A975FVF7_9CAUL|nr:response regulator [Caulobacter sp. S6]QUD86203.1 response regulator [Caulobacter sp. S6]
MSFADAAAGRGKVVLGVDDQPENIMMLESILESQGFTFFGASSGMECLSLVQRVNPRLILLDVQMPLMDGYETCRRLRRIPEYRSIPVAFLTARKEVEDVRTGIAVGGNDFIVKPFDPVKLVNRVAHWTSRRVNAAA